jgi:hypothetical protein
MWLGFRAGLFVFGGAALLYCLLYPASGQQLHQHTHDGEVGHFYQTWMRPGHRQHSCCNEKDCYSTSFKLIGGTWFAQRREDGEWMPIPVGILEDNQPDPRDSPDGRGHVCMQPPGKGNVVFCAVLGSATWAEQAPTPRALVKCGSSDAGSRRSCFVDALARLRSRSCISCIVDGEAVACDDNSIASFDRIRHRHHDWAQ